MSKKPVKAVVFDEVVSVLKEVENWLQFPEDASQMDTAGQMFHGEFMKLKAEIVTKYLPK